MNLDCVSDTLHGGPTVVAPVRVGARHAQRIHDGGRTKLRCLNTQPLFRFIFRDVRRLKLVSVARQAGNDAKRVELARRGIIQKLHVQHGFALLGRQCFNALIRHAAREEKSQHDRVSHVALPARTPVFAADAGHIVRTGDPRNRSILLRLCGSSLWNLNAFFLLARNKEQCESYCYVTHGFPPGFDYTPEGI